MEVPQPPSPRPPITEGLADPELELPRTDPRLTRRFNLRGRSLREHAARGTLINTAFMVALSLLGLIKGFLIAGFLSREDYGLWGVLVISLGTLLWLRQVGIGDKYIQQDEPDQELAFQKAFTLEVGLTTISIVVLAACLPLIAWIYGEPELILPGLACLAALPAGVLQMPIWTYYRDMEFLRQRMLQSVEPIVGFVASIALAVAGAGYWALIGGILAGAYSGAIVGIAFSPYPLRLKFDRATLKTYAGFSWPLLVVGAGGMVIAQSSMLITEARLGFAGAGAVALAATISQFTDRVDGLITGTMYPALCAVKDRVELLHESFVKSNRLALMWAVPFGFGLALFSPDLVEFGLGEKWEPAVELLQVFGVIAAVAHIGFNWDAYFRARGETRPMAVASTAAAIVFLGSVIPLVAAHELTGFAIAVGLQSLANLICRAWFLGRLFRGFRFLRHMLRAILPTVPALLAVLALRALESGERTLLFALVEAALYVVVTAAATWRIESGLLREALGYVRGRGAAEVAA